MSDQTQTQSSEEPKVYDKMPEMEEFRTLDSETQKELILKFGDTQDQEEEKSETSEEESENKETDQTQEDDKDSESDKDNQDKKTKEEESSVVKNYKELQAEFTRKSQELSQLKKDFSEFKSKVTVGKDSEVKSPLAKLVETNPNAKELVEAIEAEVNFRLEKGLEKGIRPIQEKLSQETSDKNYGLFQSEVKEFLGSPLGKLESEFNEIASEFYESQDALLEAARKDPSLFSNLKKEVLSRHFVKAAKLMGEVVSQEDKNKLVKDTGISGKAKTTTTVDDELDMKVFKGKTSEEMKRILSKHGAVKSQ